jgi:hypothetical protein
MRTARNEDSLVPSLFAATVLFLSIGWMIGVVG